MTGRRHSTPLFEIVSRNGNNTVAAPRPLAPVEAGTRLEPKPVAPAPTADLPRTSEEARPAPTPRQVPAREGDGPDLPRTMGRISVAGGNVRLPLNYVYVGLSVVLLLVLGTWTLAYFFGSKSAEERARREIESAAGTLREPEEGDRRTPISGVNPGGSGAPAVPAGGGRASDNQVTNDPSRSAGPGRTDPARGAGPSVPAGLPAVGQARTGFLAPGGFFAVEPRSAGLNYLCLVSRLPEADAARAIEFLARNGVWAVGVENERSQPNNRVFALYTLRGLTREEYAGEGGSVVRTSHEAQVAELGRRWRVEERGTSDFSRPQWYRFNPQ